MTKRLLAVLLALSCLASAAEQTVRWTGLAPLVLGRQVTVQLQDGKHLNGRVSAVDAHALLVQTKAGERSIDRAALREIRVPKAATSYKWRLLGVAIGGGIGAGAAIPVLSETHNEGSGRYDGAAAGLIGGLAAAGYFAGWSVDRGGDVIRILPD